MDKGTGNSVVKARERGSWTRRRWTNGGKIGSVRVPTIKSLKMDQKWTKGLYRQLK